MADGARFYRVDLQIHSFGASRDVSDTEMTPARIVETAIERSLAMIAFTNHNRIDNVEAALEAGTKHADRIVVLFQSRVRGIG